MRTPKASPCQGEVPNNVRQRGYTPAKRCRPANPVCTFYLWQLFYGNQLQT